MIFDDEKEASQVAEKEAEHAHTHHSRTRTAVVILHNRSEYLALHYGGLTFQSGQIAAHTAHGPGKPPSNLIYPKQHMVWVAAAKPVSMFTGVCGVLQFFGDFVAGAEASGMHHSQSRPESPEQRQPKASHRLGVRISLVFNNPYAGDYKSFLNAEPETLEIPHGQSVCEVVRYSAIAASEAADYYMMMHPHGGSFCIPVPLNAEPSSPILSPTTEQSGTYAPPRCGMARRFLRFLYAPVTNRIQRFIVSDFEVDFANILRPMPAPNLHHREAVTASRADGQRRPSAGADDVKYKPSPPQQVELHSLGVRILQYNVFLRPNIVSLDGQMARAVRIPQAIAAFCRPLDPLAVTSTTKSSDGSEGSIFNRIKLVHHKGISSNEESPDGTPPISPFTSSTNPTSSGNVGAVPSMSQLNADIVVLNECFILKDAVAKEFAKYGFLYSTNVIKHPLALNGGIVIFAKHPIVDARQFVFPSAASTGSDALVAKGIMYARVRKSVWLSDGRVATKDIHVFAAHLQAWDEPASIEMRLKQIRLMKLFTHQFHFGPCDSVLYVGDFNVPRRRAEEFDRMTETLQVCVPTFYGGLGTQCPMNDMAGRDGGDFLDYCGEWLDYILVSRAHCPPLRYVADSYTFDEDTLSEQAIPITANALMARDAADKRSPLPAPNPPLAASLGSSVSEEDGQRLLKSHSFHSRVSSATSFGVSNTSFAHYHSTAGYIDCARFVSCCVSKRLYVPSAMFLEVLPQFKAIEPFTVTWSRWSKEKRDLTDLSDHYPVFLEYQAPIFTPDWGLTAAAKDKLSHRHAFPHSASQIPEPTTSSTTEVAPLMDRLHSTSNEDFRDEGKSTST